MRKLRIYVAGPYTKPDQAVNTREAIRAGNIISTLGHIPFIPHLTHFWHMLFPHPFDFWMEQDMAWLERCDAILRLPGESTGSDMEVQRATELGLQIFYHIEKIPRAAELD